MQQPDRAIIQIQRDRFLHNWKKAQPLDDYPRYSWVIDRFRSVYTQFEAFITEIGLGAVKPKQYEMTYVNHILCPEGASAADRIQDVFPDLTWRHDPRRFLPSAEACHWRASFKLPADCGRLHVSIRTATRVMDSTPMILLDLTARGMAATPSREDMWAWFDMAHEWIVRGFTDMTSATAQTDEWERTI
jgi:uncharacterized protein (TIGR04255 family)